jgi:hypothetical protein
MTSNWWSLLHKIKDKQCAAVGGIEFVLRGQDVAHGLLDPFIVVGFVVEPDGVEVVGVLEVAHGGEGDVDDAIDIVVAGLHLGAENADNFKADAVDADVLAEGVASGEKLFPGFRADDGNARVLHLILGVVEASLRQAEGADVESVGVFTKDVHGVRAGVVLHGRVLLQLGVMWVICGMLVESRSTSSRVKRICAPAFLAARLHGSGREPR